MATVNKNIVTEGLSGLLGNKIVFRNVKGGRTVVAVHPSYASNRELSTAQLAHQAAFRHAIAYAKVARDKPAYIPIAERAAISPFNVAVSDWFNKPEVLEIQASGWRGESGRVIRISAQDDVEVAGVHVSISDENGTVLEEGEAEKAEDLWWNYTTTSEVSNFGSATVTAAARDLTGNTSELTWQD